MDSLTHRFKEFYTHSGLDNGSSHSGRKTYINNLIDNGVNVKIVSDLVGHQSISTTQHYFVVNDDIKRRVVDSL